MFSPDDTTIQAIKKAISPKEAFVECEDHPFKKAYITGNILEVWNMCSNNGYVFVEDDPDVVLSFLESNYSSLEEVVYTLWLGRLHNGGRQKLEDCLEELQQEAAKLLRSHYSEEELQDYLWSITHL
jgi:hypothetical protein